MSKKLKFGIGSAVFIAATCGGGCTTMEPSPMTYEECAGANLCTVRGMASVTRVEAVWMAEVALGGERCVRVSLSDKAISRLRRDGPQIITASGVVYRDPSRNEEVAFMEVNRRRVGLGTCGDFFVFVEP